MNRHTLFELGTLSAAFVLASCTGTSDIDGLGGAGSSINCAVTADNVSAFNYSISWDAVTDQDLSGYRVYYGFTTPLTKYNALGYVSFDSSTTSSTFAPVDYNITTCTRIYVGVTAVGSTKPESAMSEVQILTIE